MASRNDVDSGPANKTGDITLQQHFTVPVPPTPLPGVLDPLTWAVTAAGRGRDAQESADIDAAGQAQAAKVKLAQEGLVADPGAMRKQFPRLMADMEKAFPTVSFDNALTLNQIKNGLQEETLSQDDKNLLSVFKAGFNVLNESNLHVEDDGTHPTNASGRISDKSLAMINKAVDRSINEDPYFKANVFANSLADATLNIFSVGGTAYYFTRDKGAAIVAAGLGAASGFVLGAAQPIYVKLSGGENRIYDRIKDEYLTFSDAFDRTTSAADGSSK